MPSFVQFLQHSGVFSGQSFMIVPEGGFNLVCLRDSKGVQLSHDHRLLVEDVRFEDVERVAQEYIKTRYKESKGQERADQLLRLRTALYATIRPESGARALKVTAKGSHLPELKATRGNLGIKLDVAILPRKTTRSRSDSSCTSINRASWSRPRNGRRRTCPGSSPG